MPACCQAKAEDMLGEHFAPWAQITVDSVRSAYEVFGPRMYALELWTQRSVIRDGMKERLIAYFDDKPGLWWERRGNATLFGAHSAFVIKPKKLNDGLRANVAQTKLALDFDRNVPPQTELIHDADATTLYLGWVPTENNPLDPPVYLVCNNDRGRVEWAIELKPPPPLPPISLIPEGSPSTGGSTRVVIKPDAQRRVRNE